MLRIGLEHFAITCFCAGSFAGRFERETEVVEHAGVSRRTREGLFVTRDRWGVLAALPLAVAEVKQRLGMPGIDRKGVAPCRLGFHVLAAGQGSFGLLQQRFDGSGRGIGDFPQTLLGLCPQRNERLGRVGSDAYKQRDRFVVASLAKEHLREIGQCSRLLRLDRERRAKGLFRTRHAAHRQMAQADVVEQCRMLRGAAKRAFVVDQRGHVLAVFAVPIAEMK